MGRPPDQEILRIRQDGSEPTAAPEPSTSERGQTSRDGDRVVDCEQLASPQEFFARLTARADMRAFLHRLADR